MFSFSIKYIKLCELEAVSNPWHHVWSTIMDIKLLSFSNSAGTPSSIQLTFQSENFKSNLINHVYLHCLNNIWSSPAWVNAPYPVSAAIFTNLTRSIYQTILICRIECWVEMFFIDLPQNWYILSIHKVLITYTWVIHIPTSAQQSHQFSRHIDGALNCLSVYMLRWTNRLTNF